MTQNAKDMSDDQLIDEYRRLKDESSGQDPRFYPGEKGLTFDLVLAEMEERGLAPDREDVVPDADPEPEGREGTTPRP